MTELAIRIATPGVNFAVLIETDGMCLFAIKFTNFAIYELYFIHKQLLRALYGTKLPFTPNQNLILVVYCSREFSSDNFLDLHFESFALLHTNLNRLNCILNFL